MKSRLNLYVGCPEEDISNDYLCLDINLSDGSEIPVEQSEYIGSLSGEDFVKTVERFCNRVNYLSKELGLPIVLDVDGLMTVCVEENFSESVLRQLKGLIGELRKINRKELSINEQKVDN